MSNSLRSIQRTLLIIHITCLHHRKLTPLHKVKYEPNE
nr:MAG TPA: hypothetical protein [Caudoviricetes sp.]